MVELSNLAKIQYAFEFGQYQINTCSRLIQKYNDYKATGKTSKAILK